MAGESGILWTVPTPSIGTAHSIGRWQSEHGFDAERSSVDRDLLLRELYSRQSIDQRTRKATIVGPDEVAEDLGHRVVGNNDVLLDIENYANVASALQHIFAKCELFRDVASCAQLPQRTAVAGSCLQIHVRVVLT
jgi:hypothetical protein